MCKKIRTWQHDLGSASCRNMLIGGPAAEARGSLAWHAQKRHGQRRPEQEVCCYIVVSISKVTRRSDTRSSDCFRIGSVLMPQRMMLRFYYATPNISARA